MRLTNPHLFKLSAIVIALLALTLFAGKPATSAKAAAPMFAFTCFPSCATNDGRMMSLSGGGLSSFVGGTLEVGFTSPVNSITIGVFDADSLGPLAGGLWDQLNVDLKFEVFADPSGTGVPTTLLDSFTSAAGLDNAWLDHTYNAATANFGDALTPGGTYSFVFRISIIGAPPAGAINGFKLRTDRSLSLRGQSIQFIAKSSFQAERDIIYPGLAPGACPAANQATTYDGTWEFEFTVPPGTTKLELWDGDMDFGSFDGSTVDTDDPNTPSTGVCVATGGTATQCDPAQTAGANPNIPIWAQGTAATAEGAKGIGDPPDDNQNTGVTPGCQVVRTPSIRYRLLPPSDQVTGFANTNPSGTGEWEKFLVSTDAADNADYTPAVIEPGVWKLRLEGVDIFNQFTMHFTLTVIPQTQAAIGDTVFNDNNGNGIYEPGAGETGIPNVTLDLYKGDATCTNFSLVGTQTTDAGGNYLFTNLADGCYKVTVTDTNNILNSFTKTTGPNPGVNSNSQADPYSVTIAGQVSNLTADFGYLQDKVCCPDGSIAGTFQVSVDALGDVTVIYKQSTAVNDNSYGANRVGWPGSSHTFSQLVGSDKAEFIFKAAGSDTVVLDFFSDYITSKTLSPAPPGYSGYQSLGPTGGDGSMVTGNIAHVLSWNSSLARDLNEKGYCASPGNCTVGGTNLLVDSPPTTSSSSYNLLNPGFFPNGWDFVNTYEVKISHLAFGAAGFGSVSVGTIHNSPPKSCPQVLEPVECVTSGGGGGGGGACTVTDLSFSVRDKKLEWVLKNTGTSKITIDFISIAWPTAVNGKLKKVKLDGDVIYDNPDISVSPAIIPMTSDAKKRTIDKNKSDKLTFEFEKNASTNLADYQVEVHFGSGCILKKN